MRLALTILLLACVPFALAEDVPQASPETVGVSSERLQRISEMAQQYVADGRIAGIITMVNRGGKVVHFNTVGVRGADDDRPLEPDHLFRIYSMSKPITAVAAMQLYEKGGFSLRDPVARFVPELKDLKVMTDDGELEPAKPVTMHHLLTHTAGFSYGFMPNDPVDKRYREANLWQAKDLTDFANKLAKLPLKFQPGSQWHYSVAVDVTGLVIERISGKSFDKYLHEELFEPLGMNDTFFEVPEDKLHRFLPNHRWDRRGNKLLTIKGSVPELGLSSDDAAMSNFRSVSLYSGGGGLVSTAMDYMKFAEMLRNGGSYNGVQILSPKTLKYMTKNHLPTSIAASGSGENPLNNRFRGYGFGLGFGVVTDPVSVKAPTSAGVFMWGGAAGTIFWVDPVEDLTAIGMMQLMQSPWSFREDLQIATYQSLIESRE